MTDKDTAIVVNDESVRLGALQVAGPSQIINRATEVATALNKVIQDRGLFNNIQGKKFVRVEGWSTLGAMLGVLPREVEVVENDKGDFQATVELVRTSDGMVIGRGSALVSMDEKNWADRPRFARRSMAITRATGKAFRLGFAWIMTLAGYEGTPAEEIVDADFQDAPPAKKAATNGRSISPDCFKAIIPLYFQNDFEAKNALKKSNLPDHPSKEQVVEWSKHYRGYRDSGMESDAAASKANGQ